MHIMKGVDAYMKPNAMKIVAAILPVLSIAVSAANTWFEKRELDEKVAEKVAEAFKNQNK